MSNILAIARKELNSYFASPIAYIVIAMFALLFGYFYIALLAFFERQSMQMMGMGGPQSVNINQQLIRPLFMNASVSPASRKGKIASASVASRATTMNGTEASSVTPDTQK